MRLQLLAIGLCLYVSTTVQASPVLRTNSSSLNAFQQQTITGKVTGQNGLPLEGVTVSVRGSRVSTATQADGTFSIELPPGASTLLFTYVGFEPQEINVRGQSNIAVELKSVEGNLDDVVVIGYSTQKKINLTGAVATVSGKTLTERPVPNVGNLLQGRITGLQVTQPSGEPGRDAANLLIRGRGSFGAGNAPLVLIDGVAGSLSNLAPDDVADVVVLKDAASAAIYGSRSANGVILVTTKKGRKGPTTIGYRVNVGRYIPTELPDLITNSAEYMELYNSAAARGGVAFRYAQTEIDKYKNATDRVKYPNFDNIDYYFNPATVTNHNLSLSGGSDKNTFNISLSYLNQEAMLPGYSFKKYNGLLNYTSQINSRITVGTSMNMTYKNRQEPPFTSENLALLVYAAGPLYGPFLPDGSGRIASRAYDLEGRNRNVQEAFAMGNQNTKEYNINAQAYIDIKLLKGLTWSSKVAINYVDEYYKMYQHPYSAFLTQEINPATNDYKAASFGPDYLGVTDQYSKTLNPTIYSVLNYETKIARDHGLKALVGYEQLYNKFQTVRARRLNGVSSAITELAGYTNTGEAINATYPRLPGLSAPFEWALQSVFGRVNYDYKGKYLLEGNIRYDGTSRVSPEFRWGVFPSVSAGWLASKETFIQDNFHWVGNLKIRASYGTLGNQEIGNYPYQNVLTVSGISYPFGNTTPATGAVLNSYRDQSLHWEETRTIDFGVDFDMKNNLFGFTFDWFKRKTSDILASQPVPASLGLGSPTFNNGTMEAKGIELELHHNNNIGQVSYGVNGQISTAKNKVLEIKVPSIGSSIAQVGLPYNSHYLYVWDGIFQTADIGDPKVPRHVLNPTPKAGDLKMKDLTGDGIVDANDRTLVKGAYPDFIYSMGLNAGYKGFRLSAFFQGVEGLKNRVTGWGVDPFHQGSAPATKWRNAWTPTNPTNALPAIYIQGYSGVQNYAASTYYLMDASYFRMKNVVLSYDIPQAWLSKFKAKELSVYVSGDNLFTITDYEGSDPERASTTGNYAQYPQAKVFNVGLNIKF
jgi:TonB-linked SusC/RagA family outer membrane protein